MAEFLPPSRVLVLGRLLDAFCSGQVHELETIQILLLDTCQMRLNFPMECSNHGIHADFASYCVECLAYAHESEENYQGERPVDATTEMDVPWLILERVQDKQFLRRNDPRARSELAWLRDQHLALLKEYNKVKQATEAEALIRRVLVSLFGYPGHAWTGMYPLPLIWQLYLQWVGFAPLPAMQHAAALNGIVKAQYGTVRLQVMNLATHLKYMGFFGTHSSEFLKQRDQQLKKLHFYPKYFILQIYRQEALKQRSIMSDSFKAKSDSQAILASDGSASPPLVGSTPMAPSFTPPPLKPLKARQVKRLAAIAALATKTTHGWNGENSEEKSFTGTALRQSPNRSNPESLSPEMKIYLEGLLKSLLNRYPQMKPLLPRPCPAIEAVLDLAPKHYRIYAAKDVVQTYRLLCSKDNIRTTLDVTVLLEMVSTLGRLKPFLLWMAKDRVEEELSLIGFPE